MIRFPPIAALILALCALVLCTALPEEVNVAIVRRDQACDEFVIATINSRQSECNRGDIDDIYSEDGSSSSRPAYCDQLNYGVDVNQCSSSGSGSSSGGGSGSGSGSGGSGGSGSGSNSGSGSGSGGSDGSGGTGSVSDGTSIFNLSGAFRSSVPSIWIPALLAAVVVCMMG